jgi:hypothetical protein
MHVNVHFHEQPPAPAPALPPQPAGQVAGWVAVSGVVLLALAALAYTCCPALRVRDGGCPTPQTPPLTDPRPEVERFVEEAARGQPASAGDLERYAATLSPELRKALPHEINVLLRQRGTQRRFAFDDQGHLTEVVPPSWPTCLIDDIVEAIRTGKEYDLSAVSTHFCECEGKGEQRGAREFLGKLNPRLAPLGRTAHWDGRTFTIVLSKP